jgi:hypothetical protein
LRQIENMVLAVPPAQAAKYSERMQNMLGYNIVEPGFMGYVDGVHPKKLIDPDYRGRKYRADLPGSEHIGTARQIQTRSFSQYEVPPSRGPTFASYVAGVVPLPPARLEHSN